MIERWFDQYSSAVHAPRSVVVTVTLLWQGGGEGKEDRILVVVVVFVVVFSGERPSDWRCDPAAG